VLTYGLADVSLSSTTVCPNKMHLFLKFTRVVRGFKLGIRHNFGFASTQEHPGLPEKYFWAVDRFSLVCKGT
jgi:hypothetical protein